MTVTRVWVNVSASQAAIMADLADRTANVLEAARDHHPNPQVAARLDARVRAYRAEAAQWRHRQREEGTTP